MEQKDNENIRTNERKKLRGKRGNKKENYSGRKIEERNVRSETTN